MMEYHCATLLICSRIYKLVIVLTLTIPNIASQVSGSKYDSDIGRVSVLQNKIESIFDETDALPLSISKNGVQVWTKWEGSNMLTIGEAKFVPYHPNEVRHFLENFSDYFPKVNPMCKSVVHLKQQGEIRTGVKSRLKFPFPLSDRLMIHWQYNLFDKDQDEHMIIFSEGGNDELVEEFHTQEEKVKFVLGRTSLCAYWVKPVYCKDNKDNVVGSSLRYVFSGDTGGYIPNRIQNSLGPKTAFDSVKGLIDYLQSKKN